MRIIPVAREERAARAARAARAVPPVLVAQEVGLERQHLVAPESRAVVAV